jgi:hypothetical protein
MEFKELKEELLKLFEETDRQEAYIQELWQRLCLAENVCYEADGYLKNKDNPLGRLCIGRLEDAIKKWDGSRLEKNYGSKENY